MDEREIEALTNAFAKVLKKARKKAKLSQETLAADTDFHRTYISLLERGLRAPSLITIFRLCSVLEIKPSKMIKVV